MRERKAKPGDYILDHGHVWGHHPVAGLAIMTGEEIIAALKERASLRQQVKTLREVLKPFVEAAKLKPAMIGRGENTRDWTPPDEFIFPAGRITYGHVRAAHGAYEGGER